MNRNGAEYRRIAQRRELLAVTGPSCEFAPGERGGVAVMTLGWFLIMTMFIAVIFTLFIFGIDLQEGRRQTQVLALIVARAVAVGGNPCVQANGSSQNGHNGIYDCLRNTHSQLPTRKTLAQSLAAPVQFGSYDVASGVFDPDGNPVNAVAVVVNTNVRNLPIQFPQAAIAYFGGGSLTLAPDPRSPL